MISPQLSLSSSDKPNMGIAPQAFSGLSKYSADFQSIIDRQVRIASLPLTRLQNQQADLLAQKTLLGNLSSSVLSVSDAVSALGALGENKGLVATSSNSAKVTATNAAATAPVAYSITDITSIARAASETSLAGYADAGSTAVSTTGTVQLQVGSNTYSLDLTGKNNLTGLRDAINGLSNTGITATIFNTGSASNPYYLSLSANNAGATTLAIKDDNGAGADLLTAANQGADTVFKLNGVQVSKKSSFINDVVPGVTFNILGTTSSGETVTVNLASDRTKVRAALDRFVSAYNAAQAQIEGQVGPNAGLLSGDFFVRESQNVLREVTRYDSTGAGSIKNLASLGIELAKDGKMSLNADTFNALSSSQINDAFSFFGSETTGFGSLTRRLDGLADPLTGLAKIQQERYDDTDRRLSTQISEVQLRISTMQLSLTTRLQAADALLGNLESQQNTVNASIQSLKYTLFGKTSE